jgi:hypothetical protein
VWTYGRDWFGPPITPPSGTWSVADIECGEELLEAEARKLLARIRALQSTCNNTDLDDDMLSQEYVQGDDGGSDRSAVGKVLFAGKRFVQRRRKGQCEPKQ